MDDWKKHQEAETTLIKLLALAQPQNYLRLILDEPELHTILLTLNNSATAKKKLNNETQRFLQKLIQKIQPSQTNDSAAFIEALTAKEIEIIQNLAEGLPNKVIAEKLLVSIGTLKWHLHNIYSKLQVKNRTQALLEAKRLGYI